MERNDSLATISSLAAYSEASSSENETSSDPQPPTFGGNKDTPDEKGINGESEDDKESKEKKSPSLSPAMSPAPAAAAKADDHDIVMGGAISDDEDEDKSQSRQSSSSSSSSEGSSDRPRRPATPIEVHSAAAPQMKPSQSLVSYLPMDEDEEEEGEKEDSDEESPGSSTTPSEPGNIELSSSGHERSLSLSVQNMDADDIRIPPEPPGVCSRELQANIERMYRRVVSQGINMNLQIQSRKDFRNPSIYEKLVSFMSIDEQGTSFPSEVFDPKIWGPESFYDNLAKIQKEEMDRREKEKKDRTKVEFITATKKDGSKGDKSRKTKWDQHTELNRPPISVSSATNIPTVSVTSSSSGAKTTVISAVGVIKKPKLEGK